MRFLGQGGALLSKMMVGTISCEEKWIRMFKHSSAHEKPSGSVTVLAAPILGDFIYM
jgi:hypothetical protein